MKRDRAPTEANERNEMHLRIMVEQAVESGKSEREIEALLRRVEADDQQTLRDWQLRRAA
jgi:hypothetical protein